MNSSQELISLNNLILSACMPDVLAGCSVDDIATLHVFLPYPGEKLTL